MTFSVVIPTLNEATALPATLDCLAAAIRFAAVAGHSVDVVVADAGSTDGTIAVAEQAGCRVVKGARGRGAQIGLGIRAGAGEVVVVVHADTWVPEAAFPAMAAGLEAGHVGGGFRKCFRDGPWLLRLGAVWRSWAFSRVTGWILGDQSFFVRRSVLAGAGGYPDWPLMEDVEVSRRVGSQGRLVVLQEVVRTSGRRFAEAGTVRTWWRMGRVLWGHARGVPVEQLVRWYGGRP